MDIIIKNCRLPGAEKLFDVEIDEGKITGIREKSGEGANEEVDAGGRLLAPSFLDMHFHLDTVLTAGEPRYNSSGTLLEGIEIWGERKMKMTAEDILKRSERAVEMCALYGTTFIRTHADTTEEDLISVKALLEAKKRLVDLCDIQITAFPQDGIITEKGNAELLERAVELGADCVGAIPHNEYTREDGVESIKVAFDLAQKYDRDFDGHIDETDDSGSRFLEVVAAETIKRNYRGRVTAGHTTAMGSYDNAYAFKLFGILKKAGVTIISNPLVNANLQGRFDTYPKRRGVTRIKELLEYGINVCLGHDDMLDPWYPLGTGDMLQVLFMAVHLAHLTSRRELLDSMDMITTNAAKALRLKDYGLAEGNRADLVLLNAKNPIDALRLLGPPLWVIKDGRIIASTVDGPKIYRNGRPREIDLFTS